MKDFNKVVKHIKKTARYGLDVTNLDKGSLFLCVYSDTSFANNEDLKSQLEYDIWLADNCRKCNILYYASCTSRRVTTSKLGAEVYAFADALYFAYVMRHDLEEILGQYILLQILKNSRNQFDVIVKNFLQQRVDL